jgi:DNA-binding NarL/FixJ family response regulator
MQTALVDSPVREKTHRRIVLVSQCGLRQETLLSIIGAVSGPEEVQVASSLQEIASHPGQGKLAMVIIDGALDEAQFNPAAAAIRSRSPSVQFLVLRRNPSAAGDTGSTTPNKVFHSRLSTTSLAAAIQQALAEGLPNP